MTYNARMVSAAIAEAVAQRGYGAKVALAHAVGVTPQTVSKWVSGQTSPTPDRWDAIEEALALARGELASRSGYRSTSESLGVDERLTRVEEWTEWAGEAIRRLLLHQGLDP